MSRFGIIGAGKVGLSIAEHLFGISQLDWLATKPDDSFARAKCRLQDFKSIFQSINEIKELSDIIIISVPDNSVESVSHELAALFGDALNNKLVFHTSGLRTSELLICCKSAGAFTASVHPYQTFFEPDGRLLQGIGWGVESATPELFAPLVIELGGIPVELPSGEYVKSLYHCSAVLASNFITPLLQLSNELLKKADINPNLLIPQIARQTLENNIESFSRSEFPLTGPIARSETETINRHLKSLSEDDTLLRAYCFAGLSVLEIALNKEIITNNSYQEIVNLFQNALLHSEKP